MILLSELVGIILGDGHLSYNIKNHYYSLEIALNSKEPDYISYVINLIKQLFNIEPSIHHRNSDNTTVVRIFRKEIVEKFIKLGLKPGDKVKNRVRVPAWIKEDKSRLIACLRGLTDTDGSIYLAWNVNKNYLCIGINFTSASKPLVQDFKDMCENLGFTLTKISAYEGLTKDGSKYTGYSTGTEAKDQVYNYLFQIIMPFKWKIKSKIIQATLYENGMSIKDIFIYKRLSRNYNQERAIYLKILYEKLGSLNKVRRYLIEQGEPPIKKESISRYISQFLINQGKDYEKWKALNSSIIIDEKVMGGIRLPLEVKKLICGFIFTAFHENSLEIDNEVIIKNLRHFLSKSDLKRIAYLFRDNETRDIIFNFLIESIYLVKVTIYFPKVHSSPTKIREIIKDKFNIDLSYHDSHIKEIINYLYE